jgi:hypothetical protein
MAADKKTYPLKLEETLMEKAQYVAKYQGRTFLGMIKLFLEKEVSNFEKENGETKLPQKS